MAWCGSEAGYGRCLIIWRRYRALYVEEVLLVPCSSVLFWQSDICGHQVPSRPPRCHDHAQTHLASYPSPCLFLLRCHIRPRHCAKSSLYRLGSRWEKVNKTRAVRTRELSIGIWTGRGGDRGNPSSTAHSALQPSHPFWQSFWTMDSVMSSLDIFKDKVQDAIFALTSCVCQPSATIKVNGRSYKIIKILGEGGFSFVYLAQDEQSGVSSAQWLHIIPR